MFDHVVAALSQELRGADDHRPHDRLQVKLMRNESPSELRRLQELLT